MPVSPVVVEMNPARFYTLVEMIKDSRDKSRDVAHFLKDVDVLVEGLDESVLVLGKAHSSFQKEVRINTRRKDSRPAVFGDDDDIDDIDGGGAYNFLQVAYEATRRIQRGFHDLIAIAQGLKPGNLVLSKKKFDGEVDSFEDLQHMSYEFQLNKPTLDKFLNGLYSLEQGPQVVSSIAKGVMQTLDGYYQMLLNRHTVDGVEVHRDPIVTDLALAIYENVDAHGEIADGKKPDEISAYSKRKAEIIAEALKTGSIRDYIKDPGTFHKFLNSNLELLWKSVHGLMTIFQDDVELAHSLVEGEYGYRRSKIVYKAEFEYYLNSINDLDPREIVYKERNILLTAEERFNASFRNETLKTITFMLGDSYTSSADLIHYILGRKAELRAYFQDENSFYVCKMGAGNPFSGSAPGALEVVPGARPHANLDEILGSGFAEVKTFFQTIEEASKFSDLFLATSPSRTTDKSNVLLVGPQGCGKTEILRAVGGDKKSIGIFAQGSDFLTCWAGEAQKNPKRLFEAGLKLQKESRKHVHFLIDEIDAVLNSDRSMGTNSMNLTLEFQILMDGVVHYPHLSVWGATNNPERIPMPMIRRFSKVVIVGELSQKDRIALLQQFTCFMPIKDISSADWDVAAKKLDGATGDVVRKIADHIWRSKMASFVVTHPNEARDLIEWLNKDEKFQIANFDEKHRRAFKERLGNFIHVNPKDLQESVDVHLQNFAIRHEIDSAKVTYQKAHEFLDALTTDKLV